MSDLGVVVSGIEFKVLKLESLLNTFLQENKELKEKNETLQAKIKAQQTIINECEEQMRLLRIAKSIKSAHGKTEIKLKINELVREIDNCMALLNR